MEEEEEEENEEKFYEESKEQQDKYKGKNSDEITNHNYNESSNDINVNIDNDNNNIKKLNDKMNNSKPKINKSYEDNLGNPKIKLKPLKPITRGKYYKNQRFNSPFVSKKNNNIISANYSEMCTDNQEIISQENRNLKSNVSTEDFNYNNTNNNQNQKNHEIHKINTSQKLLKQKEIEEKMKYNKNIGNDNITEDDFEDKIIMKNRIMFKLDEVDKNLEQTYDEK